MKNKLIKKGGALFLALLCFFTSLFPISAQAASIKYDTFVWVAMLDKNGQTKYVMQNELGDFSYPGQYQQSDLREIGVSINLTSDIESGDLLTFQYNIIGGRYEGFNVNVKVVDEADTSPFRTIVNKNYTVNRHTDNDEISYQKTDVAGTTNILTLKYIEIPRNVNKGDLNVLITLSNFDYGLDPTQYSFYFGINSISINSDNKSTGLLNSVVSWLKSIIQSIKELPNSIGNFINSLGDKISGFFTNLTNNLKTWFDNIGKWFTDLGNNIKQWFTNLTNNLKTWFDNVGKWFTDLGNNIKSWFNALFNKLWWGNENGESEYTPPVFSSGLMDVLDTIAEYCDSLDSTLAQIDSASVSASEYIIQGTSVINSVLGVLPSAVLVLITFGIVFIFSRKVVGR
ncbi:MAG: hypothetical protein K2K71_02620 [Eubacterium sp.]|nr:hypothetical protein [Eubacterium sp.]